MRFGASPVLGAGFHPSFLCKHVAREAAFRCTHFTDEEMEAPNGPLAWREVSLCPFSGLQTIWNRD